MPVRVGGCSTLIYAGTPRSEAQNDPEVTMGGQLASLVRAAYPSFVRMILLIVLACGFCLTGCLGQYHPSSTGSNKAVDLGGHPGTTMAHSGGRGGDALQTSPGHPEGAQSGSGSATGNAENQINIDQLLNVMRLMDENLRAGSDYRGARKSTGSVGETESKQLTYDELAQQYSSVLFPIIDILMSKLDHHQKMSDTLETLMKKLGDSPVGNDLLQSMFIERGRENSWQGEEKHESPSPEAQDSTTRNTYTESMSENSDIDTEDEYLPDTLSERNHIPPDSSYVHHSVIDSSDIDTEKAWTMDSSVGPNNNNNAKDLLESSDFSNGDYRRAKSGSFDDLLRRRMLTLETRLRGLASKDLTNVRNLTLPVDPRLDNAQRSENEEDGRSNYKSADNDFVDYDALEGGDTAGVEDDQYDLVTPSTIMEPSGYASSSVSSDREFWNSLSAYMGKPSVDTPYLNRIRRDAKEQSRKLKQTMRARLSISYGHVMPCEFQDRFYCMNGGTCVFVGALKIKTCRCPIGYTGHRCMMIDQEYIFSLINNLISS